MKADFLEGYRPENGGTDRQILCRYTVGLSPIRIPIKLPFLDPDRGAKTRILAQYGQGNFCVIFGWGVEFYCSDCDRQT